jgi:predicted AlkP superfamily phosphohydrolase/phosphomutase
MKKVLVIGIDAVSADLVESWLVRLPTIRGLRNRGTHFRLHGLDNFFVGSTWPSFYTGLVPAAHGHHSLVQLIPGTYEYRHMADGALVNGVPFWEHLSAAGRRVAILDVPLSQLSPGLNGIQTVEWGSHDALFGFRASPVSLQKEISEQFGSHPLGKSCDGKRVDVQDYKEFVTRLIQGVETKAVLTRSLLGSHEWDFAIQVFTEAHCAGHQAWHLHDPTHPAYDAAIVANLGDPLERVYRSIDTAIGTILSDIPNDTIIMLMSAHDMSYWYGAQFLLNEVLYALGVATPRPIDAAARTPAAHIRRLMDQVWLSLPNRAQDGLRPFVRKLQSAKTTVRQRPLIAADAARSQCFTVFNGQPVGGIRLNLIGREPDGQLDPANADAFCAQLSTDLLSITDLRTGQPAINEVVRTKSTSAGRSLDALPDLLVHWNDSVPTGSTEVGPPHTAQVTLTSAKIGTISGSNSYGRTGEHRPHGFCIIAGDGIEKGVIETPPSLLDLAPTIAGFFGVELPECHGRALALNGAAEFPRTSTVCP